MKSPSIKVQDKDQGKRLDIFLSENLKVSRSRAQRMIKTGAVLLNSTKPKKTGEKINKDDEIDFLEISEPEEKEQMQSQEKLFSKIKIVAKEKDYLVINKPSGLLVHPTEKGESNTLVDWLIEENPYIKTVGSVNRPGIVHRLDKETSGLMVIALSQEMFDSLKAQFKNREIDKNYQTLVYGRIEEEEGKIDFNIDRGTSGKMVARPKIDVLKLKNVGKIQPGKEAVTLFEVKKRYSRFTLLNVKILSGRTHQIRVHMFAIDHPIVGDTLYYNKKNKFIRGKKIERIFLHSTKLQFTDLSGDKKSFSTQLPAELTDLLVDLN